MASLKEINDETFKSFLKEDDRIRIIKLGASFCGPCNASKEPVAIVAERLKDQCDIVELDIEKALETANSLNCRAVPLFVKFRGKKEISRKPGWSNVQTFEAWAKETH